MENRLDLYRKLEEQGISLEDLRLTKQLTQIYGDRMKAVGKYNERDADRYKKDLNRQLGFSLGIAS